MSNKVLHVRIVYHYTLCPVSAWRLSLMIPLHGRHICTPHCLVLTVIELTGLCNCLSCARSEIFAALVVHT
jgi:hypothetical protein